MNYSAHITLFSVVTLKLLLKIYNNSRKQNYKVNEISRIALNCAFIIIVRYIQSVKTFCSNHYANLSLMCNCNCPLLVTYVQCGGPWWRRTKICVCSVSRHGRLHFHVAALRWAEWQSRQIFNGGIWIFAVQRAATDCCGVLQVLYCTDTTQE